MDILVDLDGVVIDLLPVWVDRYNKEYNDSLKVGDIVSWDLDKYVKKECGTSIYKYLADPSLYDEAEPIRGSFEAIESLRLNGHRIIFATSATNGTRGRKLKWLVDHGYLPELPGQKTQKEYVEIYSKYLLKADILIDDADHNIEQFTGLGLLFDAHHNKDSKHPLRMRSWPEICDFILESKHLPIGSHPTEIKCPEQTREFRNILESMYTVHLAKNQDYSPSNILATGHTGLVTRLWDKVARYSNLSGRTVQIEDNTVLEQLFYNVAHLMWMSDMNVKMILGKTLPKEPKNEPIIDTLMDMAVYAIIGLLLKRKKWGK